MLFVIAKQRKKFLKSNVNRKKYLYEYDQFNYSVFFVILVNMYPELRINYDASVG